MFLITKLNDKNCEASKVVRQSEGIVVKDIRDASFYWNAKMYEEFLEQEQRTPMWSELFNGFHIGQWFQAEKNRKTLRGKKKEIFDRLVEKTNILEKKLAYASHGRFRNTQDIQQVVDFLKKERLVCEYDNMGNLFEKDLFDLFDYLETLLTTNQIKVLFLRAKGMTFTKIADELGYSKSYVSESFNPIRKKFLHPRVQKKIVEILTGLKNHPVLK